MLKKILVAGLLCGSALAVANDTLKKFALGTGVAVVAVPVVFETLESLYFVTKKLADYPVGKTGLIGMSGACCGSAVGMCTATLYENTPLLVASAFSLLITREAVAWKRNTYPKREPLSSEFNERQCAEVCTKLNTAFLWGSLGVAAGIYAGRQGYMTIARS